MAKQNQSTERDLILPVSERDHWQGNPRAAITLVEYGDYQCPACGKAYYVVKAIQEKFAKDLQFIFRNFPLTNAHPMAQLSAEAAEAADAQGKFWEMHDLLYENQDRLGEDLIFEAVRQLGLEETQFLSDIKTRKYLSRVREDFMSGVKSGVNGTPGFFINGIQYDGAFDERSLTEALHSLLKENRWQTP